MRGLADSLLTGPRLCIGQVRIAAREPETQLRPAERDRLRAEVLDEHAACADGKLSLNLPSGSSDV